MPDGRVPGPSAAVAATGVTVVFDGGVTALDDLDFSACSGEITAIVGANGSGKSTLLEVLDGRLAPTRGSVRVLGLVPHRRLRTLANRLGYASQQAALDPEMTGLELMNFFAALYGFRGAARRRRIDRWIDALDLEDHVDERVSRLSGGYCRRLHLALSLLHEPEVVLLDEPATHLDAEARGRLWLMLRDLAARGHTVVAVSHDLGDVERSADCATLLARGRRIASGPPSTLVEAHGSRLVRLRLERTVAPLDVRNAFGEMAVEWTCFQQLLCVFCLDEAVDEHALLDCLRHAGAGVEAWAVEPACLANAYLRLSGALLDQSTARPGHGGAPSRRRS